MSKNVLQLPLLCSVLWIFNDFLNVRYVVIPELKRLNGGDLAGITWTQDGAPSHTANRVMDYLDGQFGPNVISGRSRRGTDWPARSPDLNPLDFAIWGLLDEHVYKPKATSKQNLVDKITNSIMALTPQYLQKVGRSVRGRARKCIQAQGKYFEDN